MEKRRIRRKQGNTHISLAAIKQYLLNGTYPSGSTPSDKRSVRKRAESFKIEDGELYYVVRPKRIEGEPLDPNPGANKANLRKAIITPKNQLSVASMVHVQGGGTHMGTERTLCALTAKYYWVGMADTVRKVVKNCVICLANRPAVATLPQSYQANIATVVNDQETSVPSLQDLITDERKEASRESQPNARTEETAGDLQYMITAEQAEVEEVDCDLKFDANCAIANAMFTPHSDFDTAKRFWQKVEFQILGPFQFKKKKSVYVIAAMDSFSKWPEVHTLYSLNEKTVSQFCLRLVARYGIMEQLTFLENEVTAERGLDPGGIYHNLQVYNVFVSKETINVIDESWNLLVNSIDRFIRMYTDNWIDCLDICLIPLRNSLSQCTDFTPAFLLMGREPSFPECVIRGKDSTYAEVSLSQDQIEQSIDTVMTHYLQCTIPDIKRVILPAELAVSVHEPVPSLSPIRKSGRKTRKYHRLAGFDEDINVDDEGELELQDNAIGVNSRSQNGGLPAAQHKSVGSSVLYKRTGETNKEVKKEVCDNISSQKANLGERTEEVMEKIDLDMYYKIILLYKTEGAYPPNSDQVFKRTVRKVCENFILENGQLMYRQKGKLKKVPPTMTERVELMNELHVVKGEHISRMKVLETIESRNIFWRGMFLDVQAFIGACPGCKHGEPRKRRQASKKALRWFRGAEDDEEDSDFENIDMTKISYEEIINYIKKDVVPDGLSRSELLTFRKKAKNFKVDKGILYYCPSKDQNPRKVLRIEKERQEALKDAHGDSHVGSASMKEVLRKHCFWQGMTDDIERYLASCCQPELATDVDAEDSERRNPVLEAKIKIYQDYFVGKDICSKQDSLDSLFAKKDVRSSTVKDLVAAAMESAELMMPSMAAEKEGALPPQVMSAQPADVAASASEGGLTPAVTADSPQVIQIVVGPGSDTLQVPVASYQKDDTGGPKLEIADQSFKGEMVNGRDDRHNRERRGGVMMDGVDEDAEDDGDEEWKPSSGNDARAKISQGLPVVTKRNIRKRCEVCHEVIRGDNNFKEHMYKHTKVKPFSCNNCTKKFTSIKGLKMHSRKHTGHRPYLCNICGRGFPRSASLRYHIRTHDKGGGMPVVCDVCNRTFTTENRMQKHKRFKHPAQAPVYMCEQCGKVFTAKRSLKRHEEAHQGIRKYECQYCQRSFFRKEYLNYHLASHSNVDPSLANYKVKSKIRSMTRRKEFSTASLSIVCLDSSGVEVTQDQEVYGQLVEVTDPQDWTERETAMVYEIDSGQRGEDGAPQNVAEEGATVVVMEEQTDAEGGMEVRHIILPSDRLQQHHKQEQEAATHRPSQQRDLNRLQSIEVTLPSGTHTFTLPSGNQLNSTESGQETVQYHVECLSGETLTEDDLNAIRMLAQASLSGTHIVQQ